MKRSLAGSACLSAVLALMACSSNGGGKDDAGEAPQGQSRPGMGTSKEQPVGTPYSLPAGVELEKPIKGDDPYCIKPEQQEKDKKGSGGLVRLCLNFRNTNTTSQTPIKVVFPAGLIFTADQDISQNGIIVQTVTIDVPAGRQAFYVPLYLYCLNKSRDPTEGAQNTYTMGPVTQDASVQELTGILQNKALPLVDPNNTVQNAMWNITDGSGMTAEDRAALSKL
jgi:hypothetical protein